MGRHISWRCFTSEREREREILNGTNLLSLTTSLRIIFTFAYKSRRNSGGSGPSIIVLARTHSTAILIFFIIVSCTSTHLMRVNCGTRM